MNSPTVIGITIGDINGIGLEVALKAAGQRFPAGTRLVLIGSTPVALQQAAALGLSPPSTWHPEESTFPPRKLSIWDPTPELMPAWRPGQLDPVASKAAYQWIIQGIAACQTGIFHAMVTAPITKEGFARAGLDVPGHTELLAERTHTKRYAMMLIGGPLRVVLVTRHIPISKVAAALSQPKIREAVELTHEALPWLGAPEARIAVCGLNPHAGDGGHIGREEINIINPAIRMLLKNGLHVTGAVPADTVFFQACQGHFDAVVAMYHDQGLGPLKMLAFDQGVNVTLGLPIIRTSPDHGTAFGIAGKGVARAGSMVQALRTAHALAQRPSPWKPGS